MKKKLFLDCEEMFDLTGYKYCYKQKEALNYMGIEHGLRPDNKVLVLRDHVYKRFAGQDSTVLAIGKGGKEFEPNYRAFD